MRRKVVSAFKSFIAICLAISVFALGGCKGADKDLNKVSDYDVENANYTLNIDSSDEIKDISDLLYGIFFEDINFAADGGLYAEMVANRSFEFTDLALDDEMYHWSSVGNIDAKISIDAKDCLNANNKNYLVLNNTSGDLAGVQNMGFLEGMSVKNENYKFSLYAKALDGYNDKITVRLVSGDNVLDEKTIDSITNEWAKYELDICPNKATSDDVQIQVLINTGSVAIDMVSLFPVDTYKNRDNGMRNDIAIMLEELTPNFLRFPGGCAAEGESEKTLYEWKKSVGADENGEPLLFNGKYGDVAAREQGVNIWTDLNATDDEWPSFMTYGLGFYEYFQFAEDIGAVGVPVLNCGLYCQPRGGKAVDINSKEFSTFVQNMLDLVEFCRGDEYTKWGKVRTSMGHKEQFELKYICIGNENWGSDYYERYSEFLKAFNKAKAENPKLYDGIELIYSSGTDDATSSVENLNSYKYAKSQINNNDAKLFAGAVDQHYYNDPLWFLKNADYYDESNYSRDVNTMADSKHGGAINVFLGEYASWSNNLYSALSEAVYMTGLERNGDIVRMSTYAPLLSSTTARHWAPDLIWFNNSTCFGSVNYYMQKLFANNQGTKLLNSTLDGAFIGDKDLNGKVGLGTWNTSATFDNVVITDNKTGEELASDNFDTKKSMSSWEKVGDGDFSIIDGKLQQSSIEPTQTQLGSVLYFGDTSWTNYTFTFDATKLDGEEGFIIPIAVKNAENNYFWNIGGWGNTVSCLQMFNNNMKSGQLEGTTKDLAIENGKTYKIKVVVDGTKIMGYIDDELYIDYEIGSSAQSEAYQVVSTDETGDIIIKLVNVTDDKKTFAINIDNVYVSDKAKAYQITSNSPTDENVLGEEHQIGIDEIELNHISNKFNYTVPKFSATVIRISK